MTVGTQSTKRSKRAALARPGDPLVLADGRIVKEVRKHERPQVDTEPSSYRPLNKRSINELPAPPAVLNGIAAVFVYTMLGLSDREIADALHITTVDVAAVREHTGYGEVFNAILNDFVSTNSEILRGRLAAYSHAALDSLADVAINGEAESNRYKAADLVLERAFNDGNKSHANTGDLRIVIVDGEKSVDVNLKM